MNLYSCSLFAFAFGVLLIALLVLVKRKDRIAVRYFFFSLAVFAWGFPESFWLSQAFSLEEAEVLTRICHVFAVFIPVTWLHFVFDFIGKKEPVKYFYALNYIAASLLAILCPFDIFISGMHPIMDLKYYTSPGPLYHIFTITFFSLVSYAFYYLVRAYHFSIGQTKEQLKYLIAATILGFTAGGSTFLPVYKISFPLVLLPLMTLYPFLMGIALIRHGLFDVHEIADAFRRDKLAAIGTLATSINHEIRNPLYIIQGLAESHLANVREGVYPNKEQMVEKSNEILAKTAEQATRAMEIMKRFAVFAKQGVSQEAQLEKVSLQETVEGILPLIRHELELDKIELIKNLPSDLPPLHADRRHLEEILFNLIVNACQAMKETGGRIEIRAEQRDGVMKITLEDTGPGIPADRLAKIFEPFYTTKEEGTGLGLYIVKQLVERNGGKISVRSRLGKGTGFVLEFKR